MKTMKSLIVLAALVLGTAAEAQVSLGQPAYGGTGCPAGTEQVLSRGSSFRSSKDGPGSCGLYALAITRCKIFSGIVQAPSRQVGGKRSTDAGFSASASRSRRRSRSSGG